MNKLLIEMEKLNHEVKFNTANYIKECETNYQNQMEKIVESIKLNEEIKFILLAGPSASGKTTTAKLLTQNLDKSGFNAKAISLDDFFVEREQTPLWEDGTKNFESVDAIDWKLFDECIQNLLQKGEAIMPTYDFITGKKFYSDKLTLKDKDIIIIEGLHALNPIIDNFISTKYSVKVYLSPFINYLENGEILMDELQLRFFRRLIRDVATRGATPNTTLKDWPSVRKGEKLYIDPFKHTANFTVNTSHPYEVCVYRDILKSLNLLSNPEFSSLIKPFEYVKSLSRDLVPSDSLLKEFIVSKADFYK